MTDTNNLTREQLKSAASIHWVHWAVLSLSLLLTCVAFFYSKAQVDERRELQFERESQRVISLVHERMQKYEDALWSGVAYVHAVGHEVTQDGWQRYAESLRIGQKYPGIGGIGIIHALTESDLPRYLERVREERPDFKIHHTQEGREYLPITYIEPADRNAAAVGLDIAHEDRRYDAARKARGLGRAQITAPIRLLQGQDEDPGFSFYAPFYAKNGGEKRFAGLVHAPFVVKELMDGVLARESRHVGLRITDGDEVLFDEHVEGQPDFDPDPMYVHVAERQMYGRTWSFDVWSAMSFRDAHRSSLPSLILVGGLIIDGLLLGLFFVISSANRRALDLADSVTRELKEKADDLETSNGELERFAYVASHDLQEPLRMVGSFATLLSEEYADTFDEQGERWLGFMVDGAERMQSLVQGLLDYSRVGHEAASPVVVQTGDVVDLLIADLSEVIAEADAVVTRDALPNVLGQPQPIRQVFQNLLSNAIKFRKPGEPAEVRIGIRDVDGEQAFFVSDRGIGIDPEYAERIFVIFSRLHTDAAYPGTGIGLAVSQKVVQKYGGRLWFESSPGEGTTFFFTLPIVEEPASPLPTKRGRSIRQLPARLKSRSRGR